MRSNHGNDYRRHDQREERDHQTPSQPDLRCPADTPSSYRFDEVERPTVPVCDGGLPFARSPPGRRLGDTPRAGVPHLPQACHARKHFRPWPALVVSSLALVVATGGTAFAAPIRHVVASINGSTIKNPSIASV
jgi:hypothetical protein